MRSRWWHGAIALAVLVALLLQLWIALRVPGHPHLTETGRLAGGSTVERLIRVLSFFTVQSNVLSMVVAAQLARDPNRDGRLWRVLRLDALIGISVTGIVYVTVLAPIHEPKGWQETTSNTIVHYVAPIGIVLGWLCFGPRPRVDRATLVRALLWPLAWLGYTLIRGAIWKWYPYPFLHVPSHGYPRVLLNSLLVTIVLGLVAFAFYQLDRRLPPTPTEGRSRPVAERVGET
jgi:hypothetical protein